jgi:multidrug efflux pump
MAIGTFFTLFIVPSIYMLIARDHSREAAFEAPEPARMDDGIIG